MVCQFLDQNRSLAGALVQSKLPYLWLEYSLDRLALPGAFRTLPYLDCVPTCVGTRGPGAGLGSSLRQADLASDVGGLIVDRSGFHACEQEC